MGCSNNKEAARSELKTEKVVKREIKLEGLLEALDGKAVSGNEGIMNEKLKKINEIEGKHSEALREVKEAEEMIKKLENEYFEEAKTSKSEIEEFEKSLWAIGKALEAPSKKSDKTTTEKTEEVVAEEILDIEKEIQMISGQILDFQNKQINERVKPSGDLEENINSNFSDLESIKTLHSDISIILKKLKSLNNE